MRHVSVITGGAGGMGLATAKMLGRDRRVVLWGRRPDRLAIAAAELEADGIDVVARSVDVTDRAVVDRRMDEAASMGDLRSVVHAAGISPSMGSADRIVAVNAAGTVHVTEAALRVASSGFALVNVASNGGHLLPQWMQLRHVLRGAAGDTTVLCRRMSRAARLAPPSWRSELAYVLSKSFVIWWTRQQALAFGARGARALTVSPGSFDTDMGRREIRNGSDLMAGIGAIGRFGRPDEIASVLAFCAGDSAGYLTACDVLCDGGTIAGTRWRDQLAVTAAVRRTRGRTEAKPDSTAPSSEA